MFSASIVTLDERAAFIDLLARRGGGASHAAAPAGDHQIVMVRACRVIARKAAMPLAQLPAAVGLNLGALAAAFGERLQHDGGLEVTASQSEQYATALQLSPPRSRRSLYYLTREIFVTEAGQIDTFNRVFTETFGESAGTDRYREHATVLTAAAH